MATVPLVDSPTIKDSTDAVPKNLVDEVASFFEKYVFIRDRELYRLIALWTIGTHLHQGFEYYGYPFIYSPEKQCGKSRLLECLRLLVLNPKMDCSPTAPVLFRTASGHTQLLDEADGWRNIDDLKNILNAGFQRGAAVTRLNQTATGGFAETEYEVYAPRAIAGIRDDILDDTTRDRAFLIEMVRQKPGERRAKMRGRLVATEAAALKKKIENWVAKYRHEAMELYESTANQPLSYLESFQDRTIDVAEPLAVIMEVTYASSNGELADARLEFTKAIAKSRREKNDYAADHEILKRLAELMESDELVGQASELAAKIAALPTNTVPDLTEGDVSNTLRRYGFPQKSVRRDGEPRKCYVISREKLADALERFV